MKFALIFSIFCNHLILTVDKCFLMTLFKDVSM